MTKITEEHLNALHECVFPMKFHKNTVVKEGLRKTVLVREVLDFLKKGLIKKTDPEIAAELQGLIPRKKTEEYINEAGQIFIWTSKGFRNVGQDFTHKKEPEFPYCRCTYPERNETTHWPTCDKCGRQIL